MATIRYYPALGGASITQAYLDASFRPMVLKPQLLTFEDKTGAVVKLHGSGFEYSHGVVTAGEVQSVEMRDEHNHLLETVRNLDLSAVDVYSDFRNYGTTALAFEFNSAFDVVKGSSAGDTLDGGSGNDTIVGGKGNDLISGNTGVDELTGGAGPDRFYFKAGSQRDIVTDFDYNGAAHDVVWITQAQFELMAKHQDGKDLVLDFGFGDQLILENVHKAQISNGDFQIIG